MVEKKTFEYQRHIWISKTHLLIMQSKVEVIATKCLQHQSFNVLKRYIIHNNVYKIYKMSDVNNLSQNEEHINVSKLWKYCVQWSNIISLTAYLIQWL